MSDSQGAVAEFARASEQESEQEPKQEQVPPRRRTGWQRWVFSWQAAVAVGVLVLLVLGIGLAGGWDKAEVSDVRLVAAGETVETGPARIAIHSWSIVDEPTFDPDPPSTPVLVLSASIDPTSHVPWSPGRGDMAVEGVETDLVYVYRRDDLTEVYQFSPGLAEEVLIVIKPVEGVDLDALSGTLTVAITDSEYTEHTLSQELSWWLRDVVARVEIEHDDAPSAAYAAEMAQEIAESIELEASLAEREEEDS